MTSDTARRNPAYTTYHPRWLRPHVSTYWWLSRRSYFAFIVRELSSVFVAWSVAYLILLVRAVAQGEQSYQQFLDWARQPVVLIGNVVSFLFLVFHAITWFNLAPQAMVVHVGRRRLPGALIAASNYVAWLVASAIVAWMLVRS
jgi:succinate dehydrogenase subunit C